jgi:hypothetical protein
MRHAGAKQAGCHRSLAATCIGAPERPGAVRLCRKAAGLV